MNRLACIFGLHIYKLVDVRHYRDVSYMKPGSLGLPSTGATWICKCCNKVKTRSYYGAGFIDPEHLQ